MRFLEQTLPTPAANLAADEALLEWAAAPGGGPVLRTWIPLSPFVVLGHANRAGLEADLPTCDRLGIPVLRRSSGGGAVLQDPGCLNFTLILPLATRPALAGVTAAHRVILETHRCLLTSLLGAAVEIAGVSDLAVNGRKFSGNAQRRTRDHVLYHGTFLLAIDHHRMEQVLRPPSREPDYRQGRSHRDFLTTLPVTAAALTRALRGVWEADEAFDCPLEAAVERWCRERYDRPEWNFKF